MLLKDLVEDSFTNAELRKGGVSYGLEVVNTDEQYLTHTVRLTKSIDLKNVTGEELFNLL